MVNAVNSALSGLAAASRRVEVSAQNIANQRSTSDSKDGVRQAKPPAQKVNDSDAARTDQDGLAKQPEVDVTKQLADQQLASYDFKANLKSIKVQEKLVQKLVDIKA
ncbi:MAG: putative proximal rod protein [Pseudomonadota bacterium]|jgi:flagellar basal-body rod protein FlgC